MDVFDAEIEEGEEHDDGFLLIPSDVVGDGQLVDVFESEHFLEFEGDERERVAVVALSGVEHTGNAVDVAERELVVAELGAAGGEK